MAQLDSSCPLSQPADDDLDKSTQGKAAKRRSVAQFCQPPCVHLFCSCLEALLTMRAGHDRHMYAAAPSSLSLPRSIPLPLFSFSLSSSVQSPSPRRRPAAHRPFYDLGSAPFLSSVSSERDHKSRLSEEETERGGARDGARLLERGTSAELTVRPNKVKHSESKSHSTSCTMQTRFSGNKG